MIQWKAVIRDVVIIFVLTALGGFVAGFAAASTGGRGGLPIPAIAVANTLFGVVGFVISGCLARGDRLRHLFHVAIGTWLLAIVNMLYPEFGLFHWILGFFPVVIWMLIGWALSYLFVRRTPPLEPVVCPEIPAADEQVFPDHAGSEPPDRPSF